MISAKILPKQPLAGGKIISSNSNKFKLTIADQNNEIHSSSWVINKADSQTNDSINNSSQNVTELIENGEYKPKRKRQRLDHLTQEEKVMRRFVRRKITSMVKLIDYFLM